MAGWKPFQESGPWELFTAPLDLCRWQMCDEKVCYQLPIAEYTFLIVIFHLSLIKAAMNFPYLCKLCKDCLTGIGQAMADGFF
jgi:hypothetical protein